MRLPVVSPNYIAFCVELERFSSGAEPVFMAGSLSVSLDSDCWTAGDDLGKSGV